MTWVMSPLLPDVTLRLLRNDCIDWQTTERKSSQVICVGAERWAFLEFWRHARHN